MNSFGAGAGMVAFTPVAAEDVPGVRVTGKICELCGKGFFRVAAERECEACKMRLAAIAAAPAPAKKAERNASWGGHEPVMRKGTQPRMTRAQQAMWDAWLAERNDGTKMARVARRRKNGNSIAGSG